MKSYTKAYIPYGGYYSTPFCRWQGSKQYDNAITLGANTARKWFLEKKIDPTIVDYFFSGPLLLSTTGFSLTSGLAPY